MPASSTPTSVLAGPTPHVSALATEGTRYSHIPRQPMIPLCCLLLFTLVRVLVGCAVKSQLHLKVGHSLAACCSVRATVAPSLCIACNNDSCNQSWQQLACKALARLPVTALLTTPQRMVFYLSSYAIVIVILASLCSWWQRIIVIRPMPLM